MIAKIISALRSAHLEMTAEEIADMLWFALKMDQAQESIDSKSSSQYEHALQNVERIASSDDQLLQKQHLAQTLSLENSNGLHLKSQKMINESHAHRTGMPMRSPAAPALPDELAIARALRPFRRRLLSRTRFLLNENATAQRIAETQNFLGTPVFDPAPERWFDVALVIDIGPSMLLWQQTIAEFRTLLERLGAFRDIRLWRLATGDKDRVLIYAGFAKEQEQARDPKELIDPTGRRLIMVITDCVSSAWHSGKVQHEVLDIWGQRNAVVLVQMFPRRLWLQTALRTADMIRLYALAQNGANSRLATPNYDYQSSDSISVEQSLLFPLVTLEHKTLSSWARMVMGSPGPWITGAGFDREHIDAEECNDASLPAEEYALSPKKRVQLFRASASSIASRLAGLIAAAPMPISLPIIRLIQRTMLSEANQVHVAEVLLSGLLEGIYYDERRHNPEEIIYDFTAGVRDELLNAVPVPDALQILSNVSAFIEGHYGQSRDFLALLAIPQPYEVGLPIPTDSLPFAQIANTVLQRFGTHYTFFIENLEKHVQQLVRQTTEHGIETTRYEVETDTDLTILEGPSKYTLSPSEKSFNSETWCDLDWTPWLSFDDSETKMLPTGPGVCRIRSAQDHSIFYIGYTGRNLRERIDDLISNVMRDAAQMPFNDPHTAAPSLWAWRDAEGIDFECSVVSLSLAKEQFEAFVCYLLWQYRLEQGSSARCNHGHFHPDYVKSGNRSSGRRGYRLSPRQSKSAEVPSFPPLHLKAAPAALMWMGISWSKDYALDSKNLQDISSSSGVYKILDSENAELLFVGQSTNLKSRFQAQRRKDWNCSKPIFSFSLMLEPLPHQLSEIENDLIGGYYHQTNAPPRFQFQNFQGETTSVVETSQTSLPLASNKSTNVVIAQPYYDYNAIHDPGMFFGREAELRELLDACDKRQCISLVGLRHIGKTSLLYQMMVPATQTRLGYKLAKRIFVFIDLRDYLTKTYQEFFSSVCEHILASGQSMLPTLQLSAKEGEDRFARLIADLHQADIHTVLLMDSFDKIVANTQFDLHFLSFMRSLATRYRVSFITASIKRLHEVSHPAVVVSPFFDIFQTCSLGPFTPQDARLFVHTPARNAQLPFSEQEVDWLLETAGRHPFFLLVSCRILFSEKCKHLDGITDYAPVRELIYQELEPHFAQTWKDLTIRQQEEFLRELRQLSPTGQRKLPELIECLLFRRKIREEKKVEVTQLDIKLGDVKEALEKMDDMPFLQTCKLSQTNYVEALEKRQAMGSVAVTSKKGALVINLLKTALEHLRPAGIRTDAASEWRLYNILHYHYFTQNKLLNEQISARLSISRRQFYREQDRALQALTAEVLALEAASFNED